MDPGRDRKVSRCSVILSIVFLIILLISTVFSEVAAEQREYETEEFQEKVTIPANTLKALDIDFQEGKELEVVFEINVKDSLPIDIWFVTEDNYLLLSGGAQFLFLLDGSAKQISNTRKIVTLTEKDHDIYKLVMTNYYANQTVDVDINVELRSYCEESKETTSDYSSILLYSLIFIIIILVILLIILYFKTCRVNETKTKAHKKATNKKSKPSKPKKSKVKAVEKSSPKKAKPKSKTTGFCGYCGETVDTPHCKNCGRKA